MGWIAVSGGDEDWTHPEWTDDAVDRLLPCGTLMVETRLGAEPRPVRLLTVDRVAPWPGSLSLTMVPEQGLALVMSQGGQVFQCVLPLPVERREEMLRITFAWDSPARWGRFAVERADGSVLAMKLTDAPPPPLTGGDVLALSGECALSERVEPVGPVPTLSGDTQVDTPAGLRAVRDLRCGDTVVTRTGAVVPVLAQVSRCVPARGTFRPLRLRAPYFGLQDDLIAAPGQRIVVSGGDVDYLFGCDAVLIPAGALVNGRAAVWEDTGPLATWHQVLLPGHEAMVTAGAGIESLYIGRMRRHRDLLAETLLADIPAGLLPEHGGTALKVLDAFEAVTLADSRAA